MTNKERDYWKDLGFTDEELEKLENYPYGRAYDNLFNAEHRDLMVAQHGETSARFMSLAQLGEKNETTQTRWLP